MAFNVLGFIVGQRLAAGEGIDDTNRQNFYGLLGGILGARPVGLAVTATLARREAESTPPPSPPQPAPSVTGIDPSSGPEAGGTPVTITGTGFTDATGVQFGTVTARDLKVVSDTSITATSPPGSGAVDVTVTTAGGTSPVSEADQFTYQTAPAPSVTGIDPSSGPEAGGTPVTITGTGFTDATGVQFGTVTARDLKVVSDTSITATSPPGSGTVDVTVTTPGGTSRTGSKDQFTYGSGGAVARGSRRTGSHTPGGETLP